MSGYLRSIIRDLSTTVSSLVRQHTGLLVSLCIVIACLFLAGCGDEAVLYDVAGDAAQADEKGGDSVKVGIVEVSEDDALDPSAVGISPYPENTDGSGTAEDSKQRVLVVHLCGAVNNPGVYELDMDSRIIDGIDKAGGFREDASRDSLNLAMELQDGSRIYVPTLTEAVDEKNDASQTDDPPQYITAPGRTPEDEGRVNINTADEDKLTTLTGIGPSRAKAIIAYREEHGGFKSAEELMNVSGIGKASYDKLKNDITI